jgi:hypothetical protein
MDKKTPQIEEAVAKVLREKKTYTADEFNQMYIELCRKTGWTHAAVPALAPMTVGNISGSLIVVQFQVAPYKEEPQ